MGQTSPLGDPEMKQAQERLRFNLVRYRKAREEWVGSLERIVKRLMHKTDDLLVLVPCRMETSPVSERVHH